jgi:hypothetical protein
LYVIEGFRRGHNVAQQFLGCCPALNFWCITNVSGSKTLKMGQTSDPDTLVRHQKLTPGNNPKTFKQQFSVLSTVATDWLAFLLICGAVFKSCPGVLSENFRDISHSSRYIPK